MLNCIGCTFTKNFVSSYTCQILCMYGQRAKSKLQWLSYRQHSLEYAPGYIGKAVDMMTLLCVCTMLLNATLMKCKFIPLLREHYSPTLTILVIQSLGMVRTSLQFFFFFAIWVPIRVISPYYLLGWEISTIGNEVTDKNKDLTRIRTFRSQSKTKTFPQNDKMEYE